MDIPARSPMARTTLSVQIDEELKRRFDALAEELHVAADDLAKQMIETLLFEHSPESANPQHPETLRRAKIRLGHEQLLRGESCSQAELMSRYESRWKAPREASGDE